MKGSSAAHSQLINDIMLDIGALRFVRCWKRVVGTFYRVRFDNMGKVESAVAFKVGNEGEPDIEGVFTRWDGAGIIFGVECKTGSAVQTPEQKYYQRMLESMGGVYILAYDIKDARERLEIERTRGKP